MVRAAEGSCVTNSSRSEQLRLFVAVALPPPAKEAVTRLIDGLRSARIAGVRVVAPEAVHITLKFLGNVEAPRLGELSHVLDQSVSGVEPFTVAISGIGGFPNLQAPRVLWAGITGGAEELESLARAVDAACASIGFSPERRPFSPHVTIARLRDNTSTEDRHRAGAALSTLPRLDEESFTVAAIHLIQSTLSQTGPTYQTLHTAHLRQ